MMYTPVLPTEAICAGARKHRARARARARASIMLLNPRAITFYSQEYHVRLARAQLPGAQECDGVCAHKLNQVRDAVHLSVLSRESESRVVDVNGKHLRWGCMSARFRG
jgi:hypothetical protein